MRKLLFVLLLLAPAAFAEIQPTFLADAAAWRATDIVVVSEGKEIDGKVLVLETWKGDLHRGTELLLPALAEYASAESRKIENWWWAREEEPDPKVAGNQRMVLFLERRGEAFEPALLSMNISIAWIEKGRVFAMQQPMNPGSVMRVEVFPSEGELRERIDAVLAMQTELAEVIASDDHHRVISAVRRFFRDDASIYIRYPILEELGRCGLYCIPALGTLLGDASLELYYPEIERALRAAEARPMSSR